MIDFILQNKEWIFSGFGGTLLLIICKVVYSKFISKKKSVSVHSMTFLNSEKEIVFKKSVNTRLKIGDYYELKTTNEIIKIVILEITSKKMPEHGSFQKKNKVVAKIEVFFAYPLSCGKYVNQIDSKTFYIAELDGFDCEHSIFSFRNIKDSIWIFSVFVKHINSQEQTVDLNITYSNKFL